MITEDYVSYEVAKLLREKGFNEYCWKLYELGDGDIIPVLLNGFELSEESSFWNNKYLELYKKEHCYINDICSAPTHQMVMKWLREVYNIVISIFPTIETDVIVREDYNYTIYKNRTAIYQNSSLTYEQSCEESIKYTLENLI